MVIEKWHFPIKVPTGNSGSELVDGPFQAVIHLLDNWPDRSSASFIEARNACRGAIAGRVDPEVARAKFLAAIEAANMRVN